MNKIIYPEFKNKTVAITGASEGIGKSISKAFLEQGAKVILISRSDITWVTKFNKKQYILIKKDIQDIHYFSKWINNFEKQGNKIDILINNAGIISQQTLINTTEKDWDNLVNINSKATFFLTQLFAKHMIKNNSGNIIIASSYSTKLASFSYGIYAASKAMILSLSKSFAAELAPYNIRVNSFSPGVIETNMTKQARENNSEKMLNDISLNRFGDTNEVAKAVMFLSSENSSYITGIDLDISGGKLIIQNPNLAYKD